MTILIKLWIASLGVLALVVAGLWGYNIGTINSDTRLRGMTEAKCTDIVRLYNYRTGKTDLVCEITMQAEDDNLKIFKGE